MSHPIQAADLAIYCVNWGFRISGIDMNAEVRKDITEEFGAWMNELQYRGQGYKDGQVFDSFGIVYVSNPYAPGK